MLVLNRLLFRNKLFQGLRQQLLHSTAIYPSSYDLVWMSKANNNSNSSNTKVLVCGWAGSKKSNVEKYTDLFAGDFGLGSFGCILPMEDFMSFDQDAQSKYTNRVLTEVSELCPDDKIKLILLSLSNNGVSVYQHIVQQCVHQKLFSQKFTIAGAIFDSGPGPLSCLAYMVCAGNLGSNKLVQRILTPTVSNKKRICRPIAPPFLQFYIDRLDIHKSLIDSFKDTAIVYKRFAKNWNDFSKDCEWPGDNVLHEREAWPLLFLYSDHDKMMPSAFIERIIKEQTDSGLRSVQHHNFLTSNHVAHLKEQTEEYKAQISNFLKPIL